MGNWGDLEKRKKEKALGIWARDSESLFDFSGGVAIIYFELVCVQIVRNTYYNHYGGCCL
ncbi:hypothetical protein [Butyrivibrio sp.]|uniref:hypothetical protein n=1 Tax=Butyrivibrio sp. TaxID=28121 RepID=UPI0025C07D6E|nr:hypothetical protein [Butyrivibrio sp.]